MDEVSLAPANSDNAWKDATFRRNAWAHSRESWQSPDSEVLQSASSPQDKSESPSETGPIPNKITSWLRECRTPLGASLDEQSSSPAKGLQRNGCSFEDDLSLGAEANLLQNGTAKPEPSYEMQAKEKRCQFRQKGRSMNSTGSGKSSGTVSSVSELLDLYEEDPEEILYNLGFGREEPDISSKIPSRFFSSSSSAKGIDIKVYLGAQMQRMELENPNYALTSRFRQTEVLATVANVFSEIYSHVSGRPVETIVPIESKSSQPAPLKRNNSALNAVKMLKKTLTRSHLLNTTEGAQTQNTNFKPPESESHSDSEGKHIKFSSSLETVTEEALQGGVDTSIGNEKVNSVLLNRQQPSLSVTGKTGVVLDVTNSPVSVNDTKIADSDPSLNSESPKTSLPSPLDKEHLSFLPNPHMTHLLHQTRDSFEMEELQSNEDEALPMNHSFSRTDSYSRTASQQSDSSGFAEDPSTDGLTNFLKIQVSSDSCDSETTVTSHCEEGTPGSLENPTFDEQLIIQPGMGLFSPPKAQQDVPECVVQQMPSHCVMDQTRPETNSEIRVNNRSCVSVIETSSSTESECTIEFAEPASYRDPDSSPNDPGAETGGQQDLADELTSASQVDNSTESRTSESEPSSALLPDSAVDEQDHSSSRVSTGAQLQAQQRSSSFEDRRGRVWVRSKDLFRNIDSRVRNPLTRSSSLPTSLLNPTRVVSSIRIQLNQGSVRHCTPPCYSYHCDEEREEENPNAEEFVNETPTGPTSNQHCNKSNSDSFSVNPETEPDSTGVPPYPLNMPPNLTRSASSLYSTPADWPMRRLAEGPVWSTNSVPDLNLHTRISHPAIPQHIRQEMSNFRDTYQKSLNFPSRACTPANNTYPCSHGSLCYQYPHSQNPAFSHPPYMPAHTVPFPQSYTHPHHTTPPFHSPPQSTPYGSTINLQANLYNTSVPLTHTYSDPYSPTYNNAPYHNNMTYGHQCNFPFHLPSAEFSHPYDRATPPPSMSSTEMQLRRVLHEIRGTVQSLGQPGPESRNETPLGEHSSHRAVQPLYEELQRRRQSLNLFRTQMMDLELTLMRQQSMVYQLFSPDERHEAEQLQRLRVTVRQELQDLELQLENRLIALDDQLHSGRNSHLYRHSLDMFRGLSMDSLSSSSALKATEPVSELLREQMCLQSELSYDGSAGALDTPISARSSRSASPTRLRERDDLRWPHSRRGRGEVFSSSISLIPSSPSRAGTESQERTTSTTSRTAEVSNLRPAQPVSGQGGEQNTTGEDLQHHGDRRGGAEEAGRNADLQQLIQQIKQNLASEIRQEIFSELLAAASLRQPPAVSREPAP